MTHAMCLLILALVTLSASPAPVMQAPTPGAGTDRGAAVYAAQKCSICHALDGQGQAKGPLDGVGSKLTADEIRQWIVNPAEMTAKTSATRKPAMRAYPNLPKDDLDALVNYLHSKKK